MLFSSNVFLFVFLPVSLAGYQLLSRFGSRVVLSWLTLISLFFYGFWNPVYLLLLAGSIFFNYLASGLISGAAANERRQSFWLRAAICGNLLLLVYFKYLFPLLNFFHSVGVLPHGFTNVVLPLGISFFTFTQIAFLIDLKQGIAERQGVLSFSLFVTFFPHLIAGPIIHPREMMPQFDAGKTKRGLQREDLTIGLTWFILGLAKKVLVADRISPVADAVFGHPHGFGAGGTWVGVLAYTMQLYFDFSGYSDMAVGLARMFSIEFPVNFDSPYKAASIVEFWQRWHMTLSRYLNEYLYNPISSQIRRRRTAAGKKSTRKTFSTPEGFVQLVAAPTLATFFLAGVWHGAGLQFILYGLLHGVYITVFHLWRTFVPKESSLQKLLPKPAAVLLTYLAVMVSFTFFRASGVREAMYLLGSLLGLHGVGQAYTGNAAVAGIAYFSSVKAAIGALVVCFLMVWFMPNTQQILDQLPRNEAEEELQGGSRRLLWKPTFGWGLYVSLLLVVCVLMLDTGGAFLYFQF